MEQEFHQAPVGGSLVGRVAAMVGYRSNGQAPALHRGLPSSHLTLVLSLDGPIIAGDRPERLSARPLVPSSEAFTASRRTSSAVLMTPAFSLPFTH